MAGSLFLIFAKEFLKFTPFLQNYQVFKCKSANLCNKKCRKLGDLVLPLTEKSHQESTKSTNGMLNFI